MSITIDLKMLLLIIICIAVVLLVIYLIRCLKSLMVMLEHTNEILKDVEVMTDLAAKRSKDVDNIITNVSETVSAISETISGKQNAISIITAIARAILAVKNAADKEK